MQSAYIADPSVDYTVYQYSSRAASIGLGLASTTNSPHPHQRPDRDSGILFQWVEEPAFEVE